jgi:hypothetical protein
VVKQHGIELGLTAVRDCAGSDSVGGDDSEEAAMLEASEKPRLRLLLT